MATAYLSIPETKEAVRTQTTPHYDDITRTPCTTRRLSVAISANWVPQQPHIYLFQGLEF
jgi:hypothetical protein